MFFAVLTHALTIYRLVKTIRLYYSKFRPTLVELVAETEATDIDDKVLVMLDKIFNYY